MGRLRGTEAVTEPPEHPDNPDHGERSRRALLSVLEDQQQAENALRASEARLNEAQRLAHVGSWSLDLTTSRLSGSAELYRIFEIAPQSVVASYEDFLHVIHPDDRAAVDAARRQSLATRAPYVIVHRLLFPGARVKHVEERGETVCASDGSPLYRLGTVQDISERVAKAAELEHLHGMLAALVEGSLDAIFVKDEDGRYLIGNRALADLVGQSPDAVVHADDFALFPREVAERFRADDRRIMASGQVESYEENVRVGGRSAPYLTTKGPLIIAGEVRGVFGITRDVSLLKDVQTDLTRARDELEERVRERTRQLAAANRELETFAYAVAHDLKAPLRGIAGYSHMLADDYRAQLDADGQQFLANIARGIEQMNDLIDDLLAYSRLERCALRCVTVALRPLVDEVLADLHGVIGQQGARIEIDLDQLAVCADPQGLTVVVRNLIDNAVKFSAAVPSPLIRISGQRCGHSTKLAIEDNGIGFDMRFHDRIFEMFQRLQRSEDYAGTGVGLALVRKAMQRMGGRVYAESTPGQGSVFRLEFPDGQAGAADA